MKLFPTLEQTISTFTSDTVTTDRKQILQPLVHYIQQKVNAKETVRLNFICTHNSRRSHLSQVWAQTFVDYFNLPYIECYSGGTEATALYPMVAETLQKQGFWVEKLSHENNPIYVIKSGENNRPIIGFSKKYDDPFNPKSQFAAIMTCSHANENCPLVVGAEVRVPITFEDPKAFDNTPLQAEKYAERSLEIANDLFYIFSNIKTN